MPACCCRAGQLAPGTPARDDMQQHQVQIWPDCGMCTLVHFAVQQWYGAFLSMVFASARTAMACPRLTCKPHNTAARLLKRQQQHALRRLQAPALLMAAMIIALVQYSAATQHGQMSMVALNGSQVLPP